MHPHKHVIHRHFGKHRVGSVLHLPVGSRHHNIVPANCLLGQVQVGHEFESFRPGQVKYIPPQRLSPLITVLTKVAKHAVPAVKTHKVVSTLACAVVENQGPLLSVVQSREGVLRPVGVRRDHHILAGAPARAGTAGRAVSFPRRAALLGVQGFLSCAQAGELLITGYKTQKKTNDFQRPHYSNLSR